jgi:hypothetical protein
MLLEDLNQAGNTFIAITPADDDPTWCAYITLLPGGAYEVERAVASSTAAPPPTPATLPATSPSG